MENEKRLILAFVITLAVILGYPYVINKIWPPPAKKAPVKTAAADTVETKIDKTGVKAPAAPASSEKTVKEADTKKVESALSAEELVTVETPLYKAVLTNRGGGIKSLELKHYRTELKEDSKPVNVISAPEGEVPFATNIGLDGETSVRMRIFKPSRAAVTVEPGSPEKLVFTSRLTGGALIEKTYTFSAVDYMIETDISIINESKQALKGRVFTEIADIYGVHDSTFHEGPIRSAGEDIKRQKFKEDGTEAGSGSLGWIGLEDKYFLRAVVPLKDAAKVAVWESSVQKSGGETGDTARVKIGANLELNTGQRTDLSYRVYAGPKEYDTLWKERNSFEEAIEFGFFSFLAKPVLVSLNFLERYVNNYGLAIIILTVIIKIIFYWPSKIGYNSMKEMQRIQPQMTALREKYKDDKTKMNKELMELYKRHNINPIGGCLPIIIQIPVFIALYEVLSVAIELRHAPFAFWLVDLSAKDPYYITPVIMGVTMFIQQKMTPSTMDPMQAKIMLFLPVVMTFVFLSFPSGLILYWIVNNVLSIAQQYQIYRSGPVKV